MKKFIYKTFMTFSIIFIFLFLITMAVEYTNKDALNSNANVEYKINEEKKIEIPKTPPKVKVNYWYSNIYYFSSLIITVAVPLLFLNFGGIEIVKVCKKNMLKGVYFFVLYSIFSMILTFPKILFSSFYRARLVGLSNETFFHFMYRFFKSNFLDFIISIIVFMCIYLLYIKKKRWYLYIIGISIVLSLGGSYLYPYMDEIENDLVEMEDCKLKDKILSLAEESGIENLDVRVVDKSSSTNSVNAYMTGMGKTRRIVFWDTTLKLSDEEILSIAAHEMGHYKLNHIQKSTIISIIEITVLIIAIHLGMKKIKGRDYRIIDNIPIIICMLNILSILVSPMETAYTRKQEYEADEYAMEMTKDPYTNGKLEVQFINTNLTPIDVNNLYKWLCYDHPTVKERIEHSNKFIENMRD